MKFDSDVDARDWADGPHELVERTCFRCGGAILVSAREPYQLQPLCASCWRLASETQDRKITEQIATIQKQDTASL